jgi:prepilin-type N-terminal cleavage/methylation domain-containing protein
MNDAKRQSGMTLIEVMVVLLIATTIMMASMQLIEETTRVTLFVESRNDLPVIAQGAVNTIQTSLTQARQVFDGGGIGAGYFNQLTIPSGAPLLTDSRQPTADVTGELLADASGETWTGNCLLIARQLAPIEITYTANGGGTVSMDRYRFEFFYLTQKNTWKFAGSDVGHLDAMRAWSDEYADHFQLVNLSLTAAQRQQVHQALIASALSRSWNPGAASNQAFYNINSDGTFTLQATHNIALSKYKSVTPQIEGGRIFGKMNYSVAFASADLPAGSPGGPPAPADPDAPPPIYGTIHKFASYDDGDPLFPSGMEFKIVGQGASQRVLARVVMVANYRAREYAVQEVSVITASGSGT